MNIIENHLQIKSGDNISIGGDQEWLRTLGYSDIADFGCGVVAACNFIICYKRLKYKNTDITKDSFIEFVIFIYKSYINIPDIPFIEGLTGFGLTRGMNRYFKDNNILLKVKWGRSYNVLPKIEDTLRLGLPVILAVGPEIRWAVLLQKLKSLFKIKQKMVDKKGLIITDILTGERKLISAHYVTVYGIEENVLFISSWGRRYKLLYNEFVQYQKRSLLGFLLSNIVELRYN